MTSTLTPPTRQSDPEVARSVAVQEPTVKASSVDPAPADAVAEAPDYVSIYSTTIFAVTMLFLFGVGIPCSIYLSDWMGGMGLGAMCAIWGGPSFGVMAGSARVSAWYEDNHVAM